MKPSKRYRGNTYAGKLTWPSGHVWARRPRVSSCAAGIVAGFALCMVIGPAAAATSGQKAACTTVLTLRGWHPPLSLAGDVAPAQATSLLRKHLDWQQKVVTATELDPETTRIKNELWEAVRNFNLAGLYEKLPAKSENWRSLSLRGHVTPAHYRVTKTAPGAFGDALTSLGTTASQLAMRGLPTPEDGPGGDYYEIRARLRANVGPIAWDNVPRAAWNSLDHLTTAAPVSPPRGGGFVGGTGSDAEILLQLQAAYPNFFRWYLGIAKIPDLLIHDQTPSPARHMHLTVKLDDGLQKRYPQVADYVDQIKDFVSGNVVIKSSAGRLLSVDLDSPSKQLTVDGWVFDGHLVPSRNGTPRTGAIDPDTSLDRLAFQSVTDLKLTTLGVTVQLTDWPVDWQYRRTGGGADYTGRITEQPKVQVSGSALGFIPTGVVDFVIPNNIEGIVHDFMHVLTHSNNGHGAELEIDYADNQRDGSIVTISADGNTLDNFFVRYAVSLFNNRVLPDDAQFEGLKHLANDGITAIDKDMDGLVEAQKAARDKSLSELITQCRARQ